MLSLWLTETKRRNVVLLALAQAFFMCVQTMAIATTPLAGYALLGIDKSLATLPLVLVHVGIMITTIPASLLMARIGRRGGFTVGALIGILSGLISLVAIYQQHFGLLCLGALLQGLAQPLPGISDLLLRTVPRVVSRRARSRSSWPVV